MLEFWSLVVTVAQLVESRIVIPVVVGSSPIGHPKNISKRPRKRVAFLRCIGRR